MQRGNGNVVADVDAPARLARPNGHRNFGDRGSGSVFSQISMVLLRPGAFFQHLPALRETRQWVWVGLIILALSGYSAIRQERAANAPETSAEGETPVTDGGVIEGDPFGGGAPPVTPAENTASQSDATQTWSTGLVRASVIVLEWLVLALLLCEVSFLNGTRPRFGKNLQISIWATVPLGLMAALQLVYVLAGGKFGEKGLTGIIPEWDGYNDLTKFQRSLVLSLASRFTLFWLWSLVLVYFGARYSLRGKRLANVAVVLAWALVLVLAPVLTKDIEAEDEVATITTPEDGSGGEFIPEESFPSDQSFPPDSEILPEGESEFREGQNETDSGDSESIEETVEPGEGDVSSEQPAESEETSSSEESSTEPPSGGKPPTR